MQLTEMKSPTAIELIIKIAVNRGLVFLLAETSPAFPLHRDGLPIGSQMPCVDVVDDDVLSTFTCL